MEWNYSKNWSIRVSEKFPKFDEKIDKKVLANIRKWLCFACGHPAKHFRDWLSKEEYFISGRCQKCQDEVFEWEDCQHGVV